VGEEMRQTGWSRLLLAVAVVIGLGMVGVVAAAVIDKPTKKYCKNHKKKCKRNLGGVDGRGGVTINGGWSKGIDPDWEPSTEQPTNEPGAWLHRTTGGGGEDCTGTPNNSGYWCLNGGPKAKKGCRDVTGHTLRLGRVFDNPLYELNLRAHWCFRRGKIKNNNQLWSNSYLSNMNWTADAQGYVQDATVNEFYRYKNKPHGGFFWQRQVHIKMCLAWGIGCIYNRYPWARVYGHGDGTWHASGNIG
jgi:hypothetical protein